MRKSAAVKSSLEIVADYIQRITTFRGPMPTSANELPMDWDDHDKPIWPSVILGDGAIDLQSIQRKALPSGRIKLWMDGYEWRLTSGVLHSVNVYNGAVRFILSAQNDYCKITAICDIDGFSEYTKTIVRMAVKRFSDD